MTETPVFSIVMPVYNKASHVTKSIESALNQTFQSYELVVVCDPSTDNSNAEVEKFSHYPNVKILYRTEPGAGGYAARNLAISHSSGEWIAFLDADDEWYPEHLEKMYWLSQQYPDVFVMGCSWESRKKNQLVLDKYTRKIEDKQVHLVSLQDYLSNGLHGKRPIHTSLACVKKSSPVVEKGLFIIHPEVKRGGDLFAWLTLLCYHKQMAWSPHIGAIYETQADNMVTKTAPSTGYLMSRDVFGQLSIQLNASEKKLLIKYFNRWLRNDWKSNIHRGCIKFNLREKLHWKEDFLYAFVLYMTTVLPQSMRQLVGISGQKKQ